METKYPPPSPDHAQTSQESLWPRDFAPISFYQCRVVSKFAMQFNMYPISSDADGVLLVAFP